MEERPMPSSADRKRLEIPTYLHDRLVEIAIDEDRTVASVAQQVLAAGLERYQPNVLRDEDTARFTPRARNSLDFAYQETLPFNHNYIGTEHILLGLLREEQGVAARVLNKLGVTLESVREQVGYIIGTGVGRVSGVPPFTPRARKVLRRATEEAEGLNNHYVGTEHLLLALVQDRQGMAARILELLDACNRVTGAVLRIVAAQSVAGDAGAQDVTTTEERDDAGRDHAAGPESG